MRLYCCQCECEVNARLTTGKEIYPHRNDLAKLPFWKCDSCGNYVGCHHKSRNKTKPLGNIPSEKIRAIRKRIHDQMDPLWKSGQIGRGTLYKLISDHLGYTYHTGEIKTFAEGEKILVFVLNLRLYFMEPSEQ